jgi:putative MATE family efflux protein
LNTDNKFLGTEPIGKLLFKLALPTITAQLINMFYNLVDRMYIGHIPNEGPLALTGVGVCLPIIMLVSAFAALVGMGGAPRASIFMGKGDNKTAEKILGNCFALLLCLSAVLTVVFSVFGKDMLMIFGASQNTVKYSVSYMNIYVMGTVFVQITLGMNAFISAQGFATTSMFTVLIGALCNIILDPIFIFGLNMGVAGAALATIISQAVSAVFVICFLCGKKTLLRIKIKNTKLESKIIMPCIILGLAPFIMQSTESIIAVCFNASLLKYGGDIAVGAMTILTSVMQFCMLPLQGLAQGAQPITSYNFGANNAQRVKQTYFCLLKVCLIYSSVLWQQCLQTIQH